MAPSGKILNGDAEGQGQRTAGCDLGRAREPSCIYYADRHSLGNVVQRYGENHHGRPLKAAFRSLRLVGIHVQMWDCTVQSQKEKDTEPEAEKGRQKGELFQVFRLSHSRDQEAPYGSCNHDAGGKARQRALNAAAQHSFHKEHTGRTQRSPQKREEQPLRNFHGIHMIT